ncbi:MAG: 3-dehydroquinate synthase [Acidobacteriota bacterium]
MIRLRVRLRRTVDDSHEILIGRSLGPRISTSLRRMRLCGRYVIVTDSNLHTLYGEPLLAGFRRRGLPADLVSFPAGEGSKSRRVRDEIEDAIIRLGAGRDTALVALGGGVVGDLVGFVAATFNRGIPFVQIPTTLIGMVDSSIGGKTGINHEAGKNFIGAFHQPAGVFIDINFLASLPRRHFVSGMAEVIKCGVIADRTLFMLLEKRTERIARKSPDILVRIIEACCRVKVRVVGDDLKESNRRKILNFGHTIGHALETLSGYSLAHGEAIAIGMVAEARIASRIGLLSSAAVERISSLLSQTGLPTVLPAATDIQAVLAVARRDKKARSGRIAYALPTRIGAMAHQGGDYGTVVDDRIAVEVLAGMKMPREPSPPIPIEPRTS